MRLRLARGIHHFGIACAGPTVADVFQHGRVPDEGVLAHDGDVPTQLSQANLGQRPSVIAQFAAARQIETHDEFEKGAFARPRLTDQPDALTRWNLQLDVLQHDFGFGARVAEAHVVQTDLAADFRLTLHRLIAFQFVRIEQFQNGFQAGSRLTPGFVGVEQGDHALPHKSHQTGESHQIAKADMPVEIHHTARAPNQRAGVFPDELHRHRHPA